MAGRPPDAAPDFYLACHCDVHGWGGGLAFAAGLQEALRQAGYSSLIVGVEDRHGAAGPPPRVDGRMNLPSGVSPRLWRVRNWCLPAGMARALRRLPPPRAAFVAVSPTWVVAARRAWPDTPVIFVFACLLANCLPFTWPRRRAPHFWAWLDYLGLRRVERRALACANLVLAPTRQSVDEIRAFARGGGGPVAGAPGPSTAPSPRDGPAPVVAVERCDYGVCPVATTPGARTSKRREIGAAADQFVFALIGHCDRNKGFDLAIHALADVDRRGRLLIVGDGPGLEELRQLAEAEGVADRVVFAGAQREMGPWYAAADGVLSTSFYDTFPNVVLEGMAHGLPALVPEHDPPRVYSGMAEVVRENGCGLLYRRSDSAALAIALNRLIRDRDLAVDLGNRGQQAAARRYRWSTAAARILRHVGLGPRGSKARPIADSNRPHSHFGRRGACQNERSP